MTDPVEINPITLEDIIEMEGLDEYKDMEIVDGVWVKKYKDEAMSIPHGQFGGRLYVALWNHVDANQLGVVYMADTIFILHITEQGIRKMRKPDTAFVAANRVIPPEEGRYYQQAPDLAVEIISPSERIGIVRSKLRDYFTYGTKQVWLVHTGDKEITVHHSFDEYKVYQVGDTLPGGDILPGFALDVGFVFRGI